MAGTARLANRFERSKRPVIAALQSEQSEK
jgi:hypothetical protein